MLHDDDQPRGRILNRREAMAAMGAAGLALFARHAQGQANCIARPELTEGPFYVDEQLMRGDIRSDPSDGAVRPGATLNLTFEVTRLITGGCVPLENAIVDVWHCDAGGLYSDEASNGTAGKKFLRGYLPTGADGKAAFTTIYPGWYPGRAVHIHYKIRSQPNAASPFEFTSQLFFDDAYSDAVYAQAAYAGRGARNVRNAGDGIYNEGGAGLVLNVTESGGVHSTAFNVALDVEAGGEGEGEGGTGIGCTCATGGKKLLKHAYGDGVVLAAALNALGVAALSKKLRGK